MGNGSISIQFTYLKEFSSGLSLLILKNFFLFSCFQISIRIVNNHCLYFENDDYFQTVIKDKKHLFEQRVAAVQETEIQVAHSKSCSTETKGRPSFVVKVPAQVLNQVGFLVNEAPKVCSSDWRGRSLPFGRKTKPGFPCSS